MLAAAGLVAAAAAGGALALAGAAALGAFSPATTTTVREVAPVSAPATAAVFHGGGALSIKQNYPSAPPRGVPGASAQGVQTPSIDPVFGLAISPTPRPQALRP